MTNYYKILGVQDFASSSEIKIAYRKLSKKFHPDVNQGDKFFEERFKEIQSAYEYLCDSMKKQRLDDFLKHTEVKDQFRNHKTKTEESQEREQSQSHSTNQYSKTATANTKRDYIFNKKETTHSKKTRSYSFVLIAIGAIIFFTIYKFISNNKSQETDFNNRSTSTSTTYSSPEQEYNNYQASSSLQEYEVNIYEEANSSAPSSVNSFSIGSSKNEVLNIQGNPTSTMQFESLGEEIWYFGSSTVTFKNGKVKEYSDYSNNLKVRYSENSISDKEYQEYYGNRNFSIGSSKNEVLNIQGNPTSTMQFESLGEEIWYFGSSTVTFKNGKVKEYSDYNNSLKVRY